MIGQVILEGVGLGAMLMLVCAIGIRNGAVGMVHLYENNVQERCISLGLMTREKINRNQLLFKIVCLPIYIAYVLIFVYTVNGARGFGEGFWQILLILLEPHRPAAHRRFLGWPHENVDHPGDGGLKALYSKQRQAQKVALRHARYGGHRRGARGRDDAFYPLKYFDKPLPQAVVCRFYSEVRFACNLKHLAARTHLPYSFSTQWA